MGENNTKVILERICVQLALFGCLLLNFFRIGCDDTHDETLHFEICVNDFAVIRVKRKLEFVESFCCKVT